MPFLTKHVTVTNIDHRSWQLQESLVYEGNDGKHVVPAGFATDFASVPRMVQWLFPAYGLYTLAAILHDWYCVQLAVWMKRGVEPLVSSRDVDGLFRRNMRELGEPLLRRWVMWTGVRYGALFSRARRPGIARDIPAMALWSIIAAPIVVPVSLLVGVGLLVDWSVNKAAGVFCK